MFTKSKKENLFYGLFSVSMKYTYDAAVLLKDLLVNYTDIDNKLSQIKDLEHKCDVNVHDILNQLNRSFITPIDREDIFQIAKVMDDITDNIESTAYRFKMFNIKEVRPEVLEIMELVVNSTHELVGIMDELNNMRSSKTLHEKIVEVNRLENQGDSLYRDAIHNLFLYEKDSIELIKWKEIYQYMEKSIDACEDVANIIEGIVTKHV